MDSNKKSKKKRKSVEVKPPKKMEIDETEEMKIDETEEEVVEAEEETQVSKKPKLVVDEISLLDKLHGSDPLSAFRELDQLMQAEVVSLKQFSDVDVVNLLLH